MAENDSDLLIGWKQIAAYLRCASSTARRQARDKGLPVFRVGGSVRAHTADIDRWLEAQPRAESAPEANATPQTLILGDHELPTALSSLGGRAAGHRYAVIPLGVEEEEFARIQELLRSTEEKYQRLVEQVPAWIWETNAAGEFTYSNPRSRQILGYAPGDFTGFAPTEFAVAPEDAESFKASFEAVQRRGAVIKGFRCRFIHRDGTPRWLETDAEPAFDAAGEFAGVRGVSRDVTEAVQAEADRQEAHERLTATIDALPDLLFEVDRAGHLYDFRAPDPDLLFADPEEFLGRTVAEILPPEAAAVIREALAEAAATGSHAGADYSLPVPAGVRWFELSIAARGDHRNPECRFVVLVRDITERKRAATELRIHRDHLEELVEARTAELREVNVGLEREIAERARAERALEEQRNQLQTIITVTPDMLILLDRDFVYRAVNPAFCHFTGKREEELVGRTDFDVFPRAAAEIYRKSDEEVVASGGLRILEREAVDADGTRRHMQVAKAPIFDSRGEVSGLVVSARDITERRLAEEALRESEGKFRNLAEQSPNMIFINSGGRVVYANEKCEEVMGYTREEFAAPDFDFLTLIARPSREAVQRAFAAHSRGKEVTPYEYTLVTKDGGQIEAIITTKLITYEGDHAILGIVTDVTERKRTEEALAESEGKYRNIFEHSPAGIVIHQEGKVSFLSPAMVRMTGYDSAEEVIGRPIMEFVHPDYREQLASEIEAVYARGGELGELSELVMIRKDGSLLNITSVAQTITYNGRPAIQAYVLNNTERKRAEEALRESEEKFRNLAEESPNMICIYRKERVLYVNKKAEEVMGYTREEFYAPDFDFITVIAPESHEAVREGFALHLRGEEIPPYELSFVTKDGARIDALLASRLIQYEGEPATLGIVTDVTAQKQVEEALVQANEEWRRTFDAVPDLIALVDEEYRVHRVNAATARRAGLTPQECIGRNCYTLFHGTEEPPAFCPHSKLLQDGREHEAEFYEEHLGAHLVVTTSPIRDAEGQLAGSVHVARDITERKRAAEALRESEERYRLLADNVSDVIVTMDLSLQFTYVSPSSMPLLGYGVEEITALTLDQISTPTSFKAAVSVLAEEMAAETAGNADPKRSRTVDLELIRKDGSLVNVEAKAIFLRDPNGTATGILAVARDVTERKRAEEALRASEERLKLATEAGDLGLWDCDVVTEELIFDDRYASQLGFGREELAPRVQTWEELLHPEDRPWIIDVIKEHLAGKTPEYEMEYRMRTKGGGWKWILDRGKVVARDASGRALRAAGTHQDITARKEARERLRASEERYRALFELSPEAVIVLDPEGTVLDANANAVSWFALRRQDIVGKKFDDFPYVPHDVKEKTMAAFGRRLAGEEVPPYELDVNTPDGGKWRLRVRGEILRNEQGEVVADLVMVSRFPPVEEAGG